MDYITIRNLRGAWPNWFADLDDQRVVYVRIRFSQASVGIGASEEEAMTEAVVVREGDDYAGVTDVVDALIVLRDQGYFYVAPTGDRP